MKQYCRYCVNLCVNNVPYCQVRKRVRSESSCKRVNTCKDFVFADVEPEYQDAFGETNGYKPRVPKQYVCDGQMSLFDMENGKRPRSTAAHVTVNITVIKADVLPKK